MTDLRENVAKAIHDAWNISGVPYDSEHIKGNAFRGGKLEAQADAAIAEVINWLIAEAESDGGDEALEFDVDAGGYNVTAYASVCVTAWLRSYLKEVDHVTGS